uniref:Uncharacterized protein n=1 Tax=Panagrolaimus sp. JU765 TaxID=591449 RepID=A0AC34RFQ6_9BILA
MDDSTAALCASLERLGTILSDILGERRFYGRNCSIQEVLPKIGQIAEMAHGDAVDSRIPPSNLSPPESHSGRPLQRYTQESGRNFQQQYDYRQSSRPGSLIPTTAVSVPVSSIEIRCHYAFVYYYNDPDKSQRFLQNCRQLKITGKLTGNFVHQLVKAMPPEAEVFYLTPSNLIECRCCKLFGWIPRGIKTLRIDSTKLNEHDFYEIVSPLTTFAHDGQLERFEIFTNNLPDGALLVSLLERLNSVSGCSGIIFESQPADDHVISFLFRWGYHSLGQTVVNGRNYHTFCKERITIGLVVAASSVGPHGLTNPFAVQIPSSGFERRTRANFNTVSGSNNYPSRFSAFRRRANVEGIDSAVGFYGSTDFTTRPPFASRANVRGVDSAVNSRDVVGSNNCARFSAFRNRTNVEVVNWAVNSHNANNLYAGPAFSVAESNTVLKADDTGSVAVPTEPKYTTGGSGVYTDDEADE